MLNIAVVGCGYWGPNLIRNFISLSDCKVKMVCDTGTDRLGYVKNLYPEVKITAVFDDIVNNSEIDAIVIATPVCHHYPMAMKSLQAGKHTFIEKPMASSSEECVKLIELAEKQTLTLMVGHTFVYCTPVKKIKDIIDSDELGEIQYISSRRLNLGLFQNDINVAWDLAPHDISIILHVMNESPVSVNCQGKAHIRPEIEDVINMTLDFSNGAFASIQSSWLDPNKIRDMTFVGTKKMLRYDDMASIEKIKIYDKRVTAPPHYDTFAEFQYAYHYGGMYAPYLKLVEPLKVECQHFLDCIMTGAKSESSGLEGLEIIRILEAASESLRNSGCRVEIAS
ncbi:Gfo/Idh/MocA family protein [Planctomycetota bacterium]